MINHTRIMGRQIKMNYFISYPNIWKFGGKKYQHRWITIAGTAGGVQIGTIILGNNVIMPRRMEVTPEGPVTQQTQSLRETCTSMFTVFF